MLAEAVAARDAMADERARERAALEAALAQAQDLSARVEQHQRRLAAQEGELLAFRRAAARGGVRRPGEGES